MAIDYHEYIKSEVWRQKRDNVLVFWSGRCAICNSPDNIQVHHRTYERLGQERLSDLIPLCDDCHSLFHHKMRMGLVSIQTALEVVYGNEVLHKAIS